MVKTIWFVIPANAGISAKCEFYLERRDSCIRRNDNEMVIKLRFLHSQE